MKRYRLKIPDMIRKEDAYLTEQITDGTILLHDRYGNDNRFILCYEETPKDCFPPSEGCQLKFPKDWLEEIKVCKVCGNTLSGKEFFDPEMCADCWNHKDEPMRAEEWAQYMMELEKSTQTYKEIISGKAELPQRRLPYLIKRVAKDSFERGAAENEKKHRLKQSFDDWDKSTRREDHWVERKIRRKEGWQAHAKATNTEA